MLEKELRDDIIALIHREVIPAVGCTEPVAVALCAARATELLGTAPARIDASLSANILKNAMGVGIPGTGMIGLPIAIALAVTVGKSEYELEVLRDVCPEAVEQGRRMIADGIIHIGLADTSEKLYVRIDVSSADGHTASAVIQGSHTRFVHLEKDGEVIYDEGAQQGEGPAEASGPHLTLRMIWDFATTSPLHELEFILETRRLNMAAADEAIRTDYGHCVGATLLHNNFREIMGNSIFTRVLSYTSAACDARMGGACVPVMSNSGSGNQGIAATLPVVIYARETGATEEQTVRALIMSHLTVIYIKQSLGRLSALCGCVVAATGSGCGITYLMGGGYEQVAATVKNMVGNLTGMICDGAKPGCALKLTTGVSTAMISAMMAMEGHCVSSVEGIIDDDVDRCVANFGKIGHDAMNETDRQILHIMTSK